MPSFRLHGGPRHHAHGVLVPGADDLYPGAAALHVQLPTAVAIRHVHASEEGAVDGVGDLDPGAVREGLIGLDVAQIAQIRGDALGKADRRALRRRDDPRLSPGEGVGPIRRNHIAQGRGLGRVGEKTEVEPLITDRGDVGGPLRPLPGVESRLGGLDPGVVGLLGGIDLARQRRVALRVLCPGHAQDRRRVHEVLVHGRLRRVPEERRHAVEVLRADRIELVVVAPCATHGQPQPDLRGGLDAVRRVDRQVLLGDGAALVGAHPRADVAGGDALVLRRPRKQVPGNLLLSEPVEGLVGVEGVDHPVAVGPDRARAILLEPVGIGIAREIEPAARPSLTIV